MATEDLNASRDDLRLVNYRVGRLEASHEEFREAIKSIDRTLAALVSLPDIEKRMRAIEAELGTFRIVRNWVLGAAGASVVAAGGTALTMFGL